MAILAKSERIGPSFFAKQRFTLNQSQNLYSADKLSLLRIESQWKRISA